MKVLATAVLAFGVWLVVTWAFDAGSLGTGAVVSIAIAWAFRRVEMDEVRNLLLPHRLFWALAYVPVLFAYIVRSNLDVSTPAPEAIYGSTSLKKRASQPQPTSSRRQFS